MGGVGFAVVEFDTTGLMASHSDRATEITIVQLSVDGRVQHRWSSRLSIPDRHPSDPGVRAAPRFDEIVGTVVSLLSGRVLVAHGATLHLGFLARELERVGVSLPDSTVAVCTLHRTQRLYPGIPRSARQACLALGAQPGSLPSDGNFRTGDATTTATLLATLIARDEDRSFWARRVREAHAVVWPRVSGARAAAVAGTRSAETVAPAGFFPRLVPQLPVTAGPDEHHDYLALVDLCLVRGWLGEADSLALVRLAERLNISRFVCESLHVEYFRALSDLALRETATLSHSRVARLWAVGHLLDLPTSAVLDALGQLHRRDVRQLLAG